MVFPFTLTTKSTVIVFLPSIRSAKVSNPKILKNILGKGGRVTRPVIVLKMKRSQMIYFTLMKT